MPSNLGVVLHQFHSLPGIHLVLAGDVGETSSSGGAELDDRPVR